MREILFRGKRIDNGEWVEGYLFIDIDLEVCMIQGFNYYTDENGLQRECFSVDVIPETIGEYTGLTDKNGKKIWEGDIVKFDDGTIYSVELINGVYRVVDEQGFYFFYIHNYYLCLEVIGSIHDNPELLKGSAEE